MLKTDYRKTLGVKLPASCRMAFRGSFSVYLEFYVSVGTTDIATLCVGLPLS
jgi:hypothetical protein